MQNKTDDTLRYPIGKFTGAGAFSQESRERFTMTIANFPEQVNGLLANKDEPDLLKVYRPGGWNTRQLIHHCADSHMNAFIRFKLALTEENPVIKPYIEQKWAEMYDASLFSPEPSLQIISGVHKRWTALLNAMDPNDFQRTFYHPERQKTFTLFEALGNYDWHCRHHFAHMKLALGVE